MIQTSHRVILEDIASGRVKWFTHGLPLPFDDAIAFWLNVSVLRMIEMLI